MCKLVQTAFLCAVAVLAPALVQAQFAQFAEPHDRLLKVYVKPMQASDPDLAKSVREKLIVELEKRDVAVTESEEGADAILTGTGLVQSSFPASLFHRSGMRFRIRAGMRLVNKRGTALWASDVSSSRYAVSETASFVDRAAKGAVDALAEESRRRSSEPAAQK